VGLATSIAKGGTVTLRLERGVERVRVLGSGSGGSIPIILRMVSAIVKNHIANIAISGT